MDMTFKDCVCGSPVTILPQARKQQKNLIQAYEVGALHPRIATVFSGVREPTYKATDSDDLHLMELISPAHEFHRKLIEGSRRPMTQQHTPVYLQAPNTKSLDTTPRTKYKQTALKTLQSFPLSNKLNQKLFGRANSAEKSEKKRIPTIAELMRQHSSSQPQQKTLTTTKQMHQKKISMANSLDFDDIKIYRSELTETSSGFSSDRGMVDQKASELRLISKLWHQDCKSSIPIQQELRTLLNSKYKEVFEDGRMKCKHNDFKAEVAQILKNLERAGAPQMATLNLKYKMAVACVDEVLGAGMGEEYMKMEWYFLQQGIRGATTERNHVKKEVAERVRRHYVDVQHIAGFMLDQLCPPPVQ